jgi:hypothetical protein
MMPPQGRGTKFMLCSINMQISSGGQGEILRIAGALRAERVFLCDSNGETPPYSSTLVEKSSPVNVSRALGGLGIAKEFLDHVAKIGFTARMTPHL